MDTSHFSGCFLSNSRHFTIHLNLGGFSFQIWFSGKSRENVCEKCWRQKTLTKFLPWGCLTPKSDQLAWFELEPILIHATNCTIMFDQNSETRHIPGKMPVILWISGHMTCIVNFSHSVSMVCDNVRKPRSKGKEKKRRFFLRCFSLRFAVK